MSAPENDSPDAQKKALLSSPVEHIDIASYDSRPIIEAMGKMSFTSRDLARGTEIFDEMIRDKDCTIILTLAGSTSAGGCMHIYRDLVEHHMIDAIVATGASIVDMDFFEALGFRHYQGAADMDDNRLRELGIDRIYDTYIDEDELKICDRTIAGIAGSLEPGPYSSRAFIREMGRWLKKNAKKHASLVETAFDKDVPIFCPAFTDSSAGFGLVMHQHRQKSAHVTIDSVADFRELTEIKMHAGTTGLVMVGGGVPKNFAQDIVVAAELLGRDVPMHKYAVQITVADTRDGACSSSTLKEASSWGKVDQGREQMIFGEATSLLPLFASDVYHRGHWRERSARRWSRRLFA
ncbi:MAG: 1,9-bis(guanidino)-5-aza-nonane synthase [Methyloligellaceae bacterium]